MCVCVCADLVRLSVPKKIGFVSWFLVFCLRAGQFVFSEVKGTTEHAQCMDLGPKPCSGHAQ